MMQFKVGDLVCASGKPLADGFMIPVLQDIQTDHNMYTSKSDVFVVLRIQDDKRHVLLLTPKGVQVAALGNYFEKCKVPL